jgi:hypothetical protein
VQQAARAQRRRAKAAAAAPSRRDGSGAQQPAAAGLMEETAAKMGPGQGSRSATAGKKRDPKKMADLREDAMIHREYVEMTIADTGEPAVSILESVHID